MMLILPTPFVILIVKAVAGNCRTCSASSNGVNMDLTPPELDFYFYLDAASSGLSSQAPVKYQASNSTIQVIWRFVDDESEIQVSLIYLCSLH